MSTRKNKNSTKLSFSGIKKILLNVKDQVGQDNVPILSAGVAFYAFLAIFPALAALVSLYGLAMNPENIQDQLSQLYSILPSETYGILKDQVQNLLDKSSTSLGWTMAISLAFSIWSANKGTKSLFTGIILAYDTRDKRGFIKQNALTLLFTLGAILLVIISMGIIVVFPLLVDSLGLPTQVENVLSWARWLLLALLVIGFLGLDYCYAPAALDQSFSQVLPGALTATLLWLMASWGFSFYVSNFGSLGEMYGSISAVVVLLLWLYLTSFMILLGAELNAELQKRNNTYGPDHPIS